jgi:hypothetical protein
MERLQRLSVPCKAGDRPTHASHDVGTPPAAASNANRANPNHSCDETFFMAAPMSGGRSVWQNQGACLILTAHAATPPGIETISVTVPAAAAPVYQGATGTGGPGHT